MRKLNFKKATLFLILAVLLTACKSQSVPQSNQVNQTNTNANSAQLIDKRTFSFDGETGGCGDIFVYKATKDKTKVISIRADKNALKLSAKPQTFDIGTNSSVKVYVDDFGESEFTGYEVYCVDSINLGRPEPIRTRASKGKVAIYFSKITKPTDADFPRATVILENISFQESSYNLSDIEKIEITDVKVGWLPG